jgi:aminoglycoside 3-N-acetyltransferase
MPEKNIIESTAKPNSINTLKDDFIKLGVKPGNLIIMHSSLSKIGWTIGGPVSVIKAMLEVLTPEGTLVMPAHTGDNSEPSYWEHPPVPEDWWELIRNEMPAYEPEITPTRGIGIIAEIFRKWPNIYRSDHPVISFAAWGKHAKFITQGHKIGIDLGEGSPIAKIYDLKGQILLLGVTHESNTSLHLAEYRSNFNGKKYQKTGSAMIKDGKREWVEWEELDIDSDDFEKIGEDYEKENHFLIGKIGLAEARLISQPEIIDYAVGWLTKNR